MKLTIQQIYWQNGTKVDLTQIHHFKMNQTLNSVVNEGMGMESQT